MVACQLAALHPHPAAADQLGAAPAMASAVSYFNWVDHASPDMSLDNIHLLNPGGAPSSGRLLLPGSWEQQFNVGAGGESYYPVPQGVIGGPLEVLVDAGPPVIASQRVVFRGSISEVPALGPAAAVASGWFSWYDRASPGMRVDNIHLLNPGGATSAGTVSLPGTASVPFSVDPGGETYVNFPPGTSGGPISIQVRAGPPVIASQRIAYLDSFSETPALDGAAASGQLWFNWYDRADPAVKVDDIHVLNPGPGPAAGSVSAPGLQPMPFNVPPGAAAHLSWPAGAIAGPVTVTVTSGPGVLATQRVSMPPLFQEWPGLPSASASGDSWFNWYDRSTSRSVDDVHVTNPSDAAATVSIEVAGGGGAQVQVPAHGDAHYRFPDGTIAGPLRVRVLSGPPVLASQRAWLLPIPTSLVLNVPYYHQQYGLSCEEAALRMALAFEGITVSENQIFNVEGIDWRTAYWDSAGAFHWGDPYDNFVGDPNGSETALTGYGTYWTVIKRTAEALGGGVVAAGEGIPPSELYGQVLAGHPAVAWVSFDYRYRSNSHYVSFDGDHVQFGPGWEHAVTVIGVTPDSVLINDPWNGQGWHSRAEFESAYATFNDMAVVLR